MTRWHPWRTLRGMPSVDIQWVDLPVEVRGYTRGATIVMSRHLRQDQRRATLTHELLHQIAGHRAGCQHRDEPMITQLTARLLITLSDLCAAAVWTTDPHELAEALWVPVDVLAVRLGHLHVAEKGVLMRATEHHRERA